MVAVPLRTNKSAPNLRRCERLLWSFQRRSTTTIMKQTHRTTIAAYVSAQRHLRGDRRGAKTLTQMAKEIGTTKSTVRRWLRRDHWALWMEYWASAEEIWEAARQERELLPQRERQAIARQSG